jgi:hypothetical protein
LNHYVKLFLLALMLLLSGRAEAQGDGPHNLPLIPIDTNIFAGMGMWLSGNFNPAQTALIPGADVNVLAAPLTYIRTFPMGSHFGRLFVTVPLATLEASAEAFDPRFGFYRVIERRRSGYMDPMVALHIGLLGAPALTLPEFVKHTKSFQLYGILGTSIPVGTYDSDRLINLGTNRWSFRTGIGMVVPFGTKHATALESANSVFFFTDNTDLLLADERAQDALFVSENHLTHNFTPRFWASLDLRYQVGGETATDGIEDGNKTEILGGGLSLGYQFTPQLGCYGSFGTIIAKKGDAEETMFRYQLIYSF